MYDLKNIDRTKTHLVKRHESVAFAESVTSGHLQADFSLAANATEFFQGGITTYNLDQKCKHLNIDPIHAEASNCISEKIGAEKV
jgi:nicotinamide-nucleotide amidase